MPKKKQHCITCGTNTTTATRCTNRRCLECHREHCTPGGSTSPGHGLGNTENPYDGVSDFGDGPPEPMKLLRL